MNTKLAKKKNIISMGFSLVEMLVVIAVIGIIAAIAIPNISGITGSASTATAKRNAQNLSSVFKSGVAAGVSWTGSTKADLIASVQTGASAAGATFIVEGLDAAAVTAASPYLSGSLAYVPAGGNTDP